MSVQHFRSCVQHAKSRTHQEISSSRFQAGVARLLLREVADEVFKRCWKDENCCSEYEVSRKNNRSQDYGNFWTKLVLPFGSAVRRIQF